MNIIGDKNKERDKLWQYRFGRDTRIRHIARYFRII